MTAFSAKVDEHGQWFDTPLPGRLSDVFGLRTAQFYSPNDMPEFELRGEKVKASIRYYEVLEPQTAQTLATFSNIPGHPPAVTVNRYGKGQAIYLAAPAQPSLIGPIVRSLYEPLGIQPGPKTPEGVYARVVNGRTLYVNTTDEEKDVAVGRKVHGVLSHQSYDGKVKLGPYQVDLVE
jgi:beta-galactosidase